jgi:pyruvate kinase
MFPRHKTKIVATIGPASDSPEVLRRLIQAGMNVARLNFSHGDFTGHAGTIARLRAAAEQAGRPIAIMADLPGPKIRIGSFGEEPVTLAPDDLFTLTTEPVVGTAARVSVSLPSLPAVVRPGDRLFLNDGYIQLEVVRSAATEVTCRVRVGGELRSRKGLNLPGIDLGACAFTEHDRRCLAFALEHGVDAVSQSFVDGAEDIEAVRAAARHLGGNPFIIAKIERSRALERIGEILAAADGIMVARGDLGVEIPIEKIALAQKRLMRLANLEAKPVITATQMLESMTANRLPTRAEATDVANAILDGTDAVMLSGESAMGRYPVESVEMLARIAAEVEPQRPMYGHGHASAAAARSEAIPLQELIAASVEATIRRITPATVIVPTHSGGTARRISRFHLPVWITAVSSEAKTCQDLLFSYGVFPCREPDHPDEWRDWAKNWVSAHALAGRYVVLTEGPSRKYPGRNDRMEVIDLGPSAA